MNAQTCFRHFSGPVLKPSNHTRKFLPAKITLTNLPVGDSFRFAKKCVCRDLLTAKRLNAWSTQCYGKLVFLSLPVKYPEGVPSVKWLMYVGATLMSLGPEPKIFSMEKQVACSTPLIFAPRSPTDVNCCRCNKSGPPGTFRCSSSLGISLQGRFLLVCDRLLLLRRNLPSSRR